jgi:transposase
VLGFIRSKASYFIHYASNVKKNNGKKKMFAYAFAFIDLKTNMYVGYGTGMRSEKEAFYSAK